MLGRAFLVCKWIVFLIVMTVYVIIVVPGFLLISTAMVLIESLEVILKVIFFIPVFIIFGISTFDQFEYKFKEDRETSYTSFVGDFLMMAFMNVLFKARFKERFEKFMFNKE